MWKLSCYLLLVFLLLSANGLDTLLPTAALDFVTFSRFEKKKVLTESGFIYNPQLI